MHPTGEELATPTVVVPKRLPSSGSDADQRSQSLPSSASARNSHRTCARSSDSMRGLLSRRRIPLQHAAEQGSGYRSGGCGSSAGRRFCAVAAQGGRVVLPTEKVVVIVGATGTGKSKLAIDLALRLPPAEVVNSDKMQVYAALDATTNKITAAEGRGVPHHLLGDVDPAAGELSPAGFRELGGAVVADIAARGGLPIVAGGSNSFVHALLADPYDPSHDPFIASPAALSPVGLRYPCCLLWVDVARPVLYDHLDRRVDEMLKSKMFEELEENYDPERRGRGYTGPWRAIGVPEFDRFFERYPPGGGGGPGRAAAYRAAVDEIKENTRRLADVQVGKIQRLKELGWPLQRVDATAAVWAALQGSEKGEVQAAWEEGVLRPSVEAVERFLLDNVEAAAAAAAAALVVEEEEEEEANEEGVVAGRLRLTLA
ncbi:hypothetical protein Taro_024791 [Colocasia esculenta]|uniref:Uncharacterized protein n=1 Tax=Colocasia esculenta TaxID=4460 RepID=A0A843VEN2_COLES|nr:hypothetical protein [Colocasia esculenta]